MSFITEQLQRAQKPNGSKNGPQDVSPSELYINLAARPKPISKTKINLRGSDISVAVMVLSTLERQNCTLDAIKRLRLEGFKDPTTELPNEVITDAKAVQVIWRSIKRPSPTIDSNGKERWHPAFFSADEVEQLTTDELVKFLDLYMYTEASLGGRIENLTEADLDNWIAVLADGGEEVAPLFNGTSELKDLLLHKLAIRLRSMSGSQSTSSFPSLDLSQLEILDPGTSFSTEQPSIHANGTNENDPEEQQSSNSSQILPREKIEELAKKFQLKE